MRYEKDESTYILGSFEPGDTVTIDVYRLRDGVKVVDGASCAEVGDTGVFAYEFSQVISQKEEYLWVMNNGSYTRMGKVVLGGWMDLVYERIRDYIDAAISSRSSHTPSDVDSVLSASHGNGSWEGATPAEIDAQLSASHGSGSWEGSPAEDIADAVWDELTRDHKTPGTFGERVRKGEFA